MRQIHDGHRPNRAAAAVPCGGGVPEYLANTVNALAAMRAGGVRVADLAQAPGGRLPA